MAFITASQPKEILVLLPVHLRDFFLYDFILEI